MLAGDQPQEDLEANATQAVRQALPQWHIWHGTDTFAICFCSILPWAIQYQDAGEVWALAYLERDFVA